MFYLVRIFKTSDPEDSISSDTERTVGVWGLSVRLCQVLQQGAGSLNIKRLLLVKENQLSQVKEFSSFLCMGRCKSLGLLKAFFSYAPQLSGGSILRFDLICDLIFTSLVPQLMDHREWLQPDSCWIAGIVLPGCPLSSEIHIWRAGLDVGRDILFNDMVGLPRWHSSKESTCQSRSCRRPRFNPWVRKIPWRKKWQPTPVFLPGERHGQRSLGGCSPWGCKESDTAEQACTTTPFLRGFKAKDVKDEGHDSVKAIVGVKATDLKDLLPTVQQGWGQKVPATRSSQRTSRPLCTGLPAVLCMSVPGWGLSRGPDLGARWPPRSQLDPSRSRLFPQDSYDASTHTLPTAGPQLPLDPSPPGARIQQEACRPQRNTSHQRMD
ncbi:uncharacterized protein LOC122680493 [Cervus elaphus]|uniref:uncharacterized protein LOC122680493 n=1 Tax=Cervus elaphus TaxID=9860 RepID=UPI001CC2999F|nr:uncharacterized protein LOC122680493 [Cervus elaphus]